MSVALPIAGLVQPALMMRAVRGTVAVDAAVIVTMLLARRGLLKPAAWLLIASEVALVSVIATHAGGVRSPGVQFFLVFVLLAGILLDARAAVYTAIACGTIALGFVFAENAGVLPPPIVPYSAAVLWLLTCLYMGLIIVLSRLAAQRIEGALTRAEAELVERRKAAAGREESERKRERLEAQLRQSQKMEALGTLAGGIAHDFNNILSAVIGNLDLAISDTPPDAPSRKSLDEVAKATVRAAELVKRILLFSRKQESERRVIHLEPVVQEVVQLLRTSLPMRVHVQQRFERDVPTVSADTGQIHQIVMNLATNAIHAMAARGGTLTVELDRAVITGESDSPSPDLVPGAYARISIRDTGVGMSAEILERLFEPFFTTKGHAGTGLGLSVVHGIVQEHDGAITVESVVGQGTVFRVYLPEAVIAPVAAADARAAAHGDGQHILFVDDEEPIVFLMTRLLKRLGYTCTGFTSAEAALQAFRTEPMSFDAAITDLSMPDMTGLQLAQALVDIRPGFPVALASGYASDMEHASQASAVVARISKPIVTEQLARTLRQMLGSEKPVGS